MAFVSLPFDQAIVFVPSTEEYSEPRPASIVLSCCLWWKYTSSEDQDESKSIQLLQCDQGISLRRLQSHLDWSSVEQSVWCEDTEHGTAIFLHGSLTCGKYRNRAVEIGIVLEPVHVRDEFLSVVRVRTAPWQLLYRRMLKWRSRPHHSERVVECIENANYTVGSEGSCNDGTTVSFSGDDPEDDQDRWLSLPYALRSLKNEIDRKHFDELELCISVVESIAFMFGNVGWSTLFLDGKSFCELYDIQLAVESAYEKLFSLLHPNTKKEDALLRDFFEAQEESLCALETIEISGRKRIPLPRRAVKSVASSLGRLYAVIGSLIYSIDVVERCNASRTPFGCTKKYKCLARNFDGLVVWEVESDEVVRNKYCLLRECAATTRRFRFEDEPHFWYADLLRELASTYEEFDGSIVPDGLYRECLSETRRLLGEDHASERLVEILMKLAERCVANDSRGRAIGLYREALNVSWQIYGKVDRSSIADILFEIGNELGRDLRHDEAEPFLLKSYEMRRRLGEEADGSKLGLVLLVLADVLFDLGSLNDAEERYRECLEMWESIYGAGFDDVNVAYALIKLAEVTEKKGELNEAQHVFNECLLMRQRLWNQDHDSIAEVMFELGRLRAEIGDLDEAELLCRECVDMLRRVHGGDFDSPILALALHELAKLYRRKGDTPKASRVHREFFDFIHVRMDESTYWWIEEETWCSSFPTKRMSMVRMNFDDSDDTERALRDALSTHQNGNDECHQPNVVLAMHQLGGFILRKSVRPGYRAGERIIRESFSIVKEMSVNQVDHWLVCVDRWFEVCCLKGIASWCRLNLVNKTGERLLRECLNILRDASDETKDSMDIADCLRDLSQLISSENRRSEKRDLLWESFEMARRISGDSADNFRLVVDALSSVIDFELEHEPGENVLSLCRDCLDSARHVHGDGVDHEDVARCSGMLGRVAKKQRDLEGSERWYRMTWEMNQRLQGDENDSRELYELGDLALASSRFDDAERIYREMFDGRLIGIDCAITFQVLAHSLLVAGKEQEAKRLFLECLKAYEHLDITKLELFERQYMSWSTDFASEKCSDSASFCYNFLDLSKVFLSNQQLHRGVVVALLLFVGEFPNPRTAERWARECLSMVDRWFIDEEDHAFVSRVYFGLACSVGDQEAERLYRDSLGIDRRLYGSNTTHAETAITLYALANLLLKQGILDEAELLYRDFLKMHKKLYNDESEGSDGSVFREPSAEVAANVVFDLADAHLNRGSSSIAEKLLRECVDLLRELDIDCTRYVDEAFVLQQLASLLMNQGLLNEAKDLFCESRDLFGQVNVHWQAWVGRPKEIFLRILNPSDEREKEGYRDSFKFHGLVSQHDGIIFILDALGNIAWFENCYEDAGKFLHRSLMMNRLCSEECGNKLRILEPAFCLAEVKLHEHSYEEAIDLYREALDVYRVTYEDGYQYDSEPILFGLAVSLFENDELDKTSKILEECRRLVEETILCSIEVWEVDYWQSRVAYEKRDMSAAKCCIEKSLYALGDNQFGLHVVLRMQAILALDRGELEEAEKYAWKSLTVCRSIDREESSKGDETACTLCVLANVEIAKGELEEAEEYIREGFELRRERHGSDADHAGIAELLSVRAQVQFERGSKIDAVNTLEQSVKMYQRVFRKTPSHRYVTRAQSKLAQWRGEGGS